MEVECDRCGKVINVDEDNFYNELVSRGWGVLLDKEPKPICRDCKLEWMEGDYDDS